MSQNSAASDELAADRESVPQDQIEVHWQHPRHELENPVLLVWPNPLRENWVAEVLADETATVVCREVLYRETTDDDDEDGEIQKRVETVTPYDEIPQYVEEALLTYDSEYGPIGEVVNPVNTADEEPPSDPQVTLEEYFETPPADSAAVTTENSDTESEMGERPMVQNLLCGGRYSLGIRRNRTR